ncbi:MAG: CoA transferase [Alphaproteobacteria bacterium]|jgi:glutaconate CoA-transferase subunit A|nr:CoA transferase [Alphaproteobacteria bacterium]MDP6518047.1 CoA transferase [Alphaproteobacteria bacterium]
MIGPERASKLCSLAEAAARVPDGARIALGGFSIYQHPIAFVHELIRQRRRDLTVVGVVNGNDVDLLAGAGCLQRIETSYVGLEKYGLAPNFRRRVESGALAVVDYPELMSWDRFRASQENYTFLQASFLGGTDIVRHNPDIKPFTCPLSGRQLWAVPPADPDVVVIHALAADAFGNVLVAERRLMPQSLDIALARSCDTVIVTAERIVENAEIRRRARLNEIPSYRTNCVVEVPWGAHPCPVLGFSQTDDEHFQTYVAASASEDGFKRYLDEYVFGVADHAGYLDKIGMARLLALQSTALVT